MFPPQAQNSWDSNSAGAGNYNQYPPANQWQQSNDNQNNSSRGLIIAVIALASLLVLLVSGGAAYYFFSGAGDKQTITAGASETSGVASQSSPQRMRATPASTTTKATDERAKNFSAPSSWAQCGGSGAPGNLNLYYVGSSATTCPFAGAVRDSFVEYYNSTKRLSGTIRAYSTVTGKTYTMVCTDNGDYVTCTGGNNAVVHIV